MAEASITFTYEDLQNLPDDGKRREIIDGELHVTPSPNKKHQSVAVNLTRILSTHVRRHGLGKVFVAPLDVVLGDLDVVQPDVLYVSTSRLKILTTSNVAGAPDLVIEVLSEATRKIDEVGKKKLYERAGVAEYWLVDPLLETIKVYRASGGRFERLAELSAEAGGFVETPLLPGLRIALAEVFED